MAVEECPLPEVAEALKPYIRTRREVNAIRHSLQLHLQEKLYPNCQDRPSTSLIDSEHIITGSSPPSLTGVRKAYWDALQAHKAALTSYNALKADIERLSDFEAADYLNGTTSGATYVRQDLLPLIREREKQRKLDVLESTITKIIHTGDEDGVMSLDEKLKQNLGDLPTPPSSSVPTFNSRSTVADAKLLQMKQATVLLKHKLDAQMSRADADRANTTGKLVEKSRTKGFQLALQELTAWMEEKLAIIALADASSGTVAKSSPPRTAKHDSEQSPEDIKKQIEELYEQYLSARQRLIYTVNNLSTQDNEDRNSFDDSIATSRENFPNNASAPSRFEILLPYVPKILELKQAEQEVSQQSAYTRKRIDASESDFDNTIRRLADESHMVPPNASHGKDWLQAAIDSNHALENSINERVKHGNSAVAAARKTLDSIKELPRSYNRLSSIHQDE